MNLTDELNAFYYSNALCDLRLMNKQFVDKNITYNTLLYLEIIYSMNGTCTVSKLAEMLYVSKPGVTSKINELIKEDLVVKTSDKNDKRINYLSINEEKLPLYRIYRDQDNRAIKTIEEKYSKKEIEKFCEILNIITTINYEENNKNG